MLRRFGLMNFKCFERLDLPCTSLNLLCGLNGMGKSSVIQALLVLRQSFETGDLQEGRLILGGALTDLGAGSDVLFEDADDEVIGFVLFGNEPKSKYPSAEFSIAQDPWASAFRYSRADDQLMAVGHGEVEKVLRAESAPQAWRSIPSSGMRNLIELVEPMNLSTDWRAVPPFAGRLVYVQAERVGPRKSYPLSEILARRGDFGARGEYAWNFLNGHQNELLQVDDPRCGDMPGRRRLLDVIDHWLQDVSPGAHLQLESVPAADAVIAGFSFDRPDDVPTRRHRATNVGFGLSYVLPVVLALLSEPGTLCLIENPEAHLHPRGQTKLAELAARAAAAGVQVFVETHSDHFIDGIRIAVRDGLIAPTEASVHYFERRGGRTVVSSPTVDADGTPCRAGRPVSSISTRTTSRDCSRRGTGRARAGPETMRVWHPLAGMRQ